MKSTPPNEYRYRSKTDQFGTTDADGMNGAFSFVLKGKGHKVTAHCIVSDGTGPNGKEEVQWEHVSVHIEEYRKLRTPTWDEMCAIKDIFWDAEETVIQFHPPKSEYVNMHPHVLHLWRYKGEETPRPPKICV